MAVSHENRRARRAGADRALHDARAMNLARLKPDRAFLRNRIAQQLFALFAVCSLAPLVAMTLFSYRQVSRQLETVADEQLHHACKDVGMNLIERLSLLESDLDSLIATFPPQDRDMTWPSSDEMRVYLAGRYRGIVLRAVSGEAIAGFGLPLASIPLSAQEVRHLAQDKVLVKTRDNGQGVRSVYVAKMTRRLPAMDTVIMGEVNPSYLWESDAIVNSDAEIMVVNEARQVLYASLPHAAPLRELAAAMRGGQSSGHLEWSDGAETYVANYWTAFMHPTFFDNWIVVYSENKRDALAPTGSFQSAFILIAALMFLVAAFLSILVIRHRMTPVEQLCTQTRRIAAKDFRARVTIDSRNEFGELGAAFNQMAGNLENYFNTMEITSRIGIALSQEEEERRLLETIVAGAKSLANAEGAALYLVSGEELSLGLMQMDSPGTTDQTAASSRWIQAEELPPLAGLNPFYDCGTLCCPDIYASDSDRFDFHKEWDRLKGCHTRSLLSVPMVNHEGEVTGILQLFNARNPETGTFGPFSDDSVTLVESLASQAAVVLSKNHLMADMLRLFEGLTELVAMAVDAKSPHTAGHCSRVPVLTMMLAEAACRAKEGAFKDFKLTAEERYELKISALLHDCGKIATPVHIMDKATKLQGILDRMDLVDARFEILRRDRLIQLYETRLSGSGGESATNPLHDVRREWLAWNRQVDADLQFLLACNSAQHPMDPDSRQRILDIAQKYSWTALSGELHPAVTAEEAESLMIAEGTLSPRERAIVNEHVTLTMRMLQSLPLPKHLRNLPAHAGAHHERMDGSGYPQGLTREEISIQGRMISLADVFEALTAADRPYKRATNVMEAVEILRAMKNNGHIDPDLFDLFIREKLHLAYAALFLPLPMQDAPVSSDTPA